MSQQTNQKARCFGQDDPMMAEYHDQEWGVPVRDSHALFEHLSLDIFQSGLSWRIILAKRQGFRRAFANFDPEIVASYSSDDIERLLADEEIVRNRKKIEATINNARALLDMERSGEDFAEFLWGFVGHQPHHNKGASDWSEVPSKSEESAAMAHQLKERGFSFVGPTVCYAFMQAVGMIDDHLVSCFRYRGEE
jgi:DNA-3-methyladenine glycosylase I